MYKKFIDKALTEGEAIELMNVRGADISELFSTANKVREIYCGNEIHTCTITNARSGKCKENCRFCAQSSHYNTNVSVYEMKSNIEMDSEKVRAKELGSSHFGIVTSGHSITSSEKEFSQILDLLDCNKSDSISLCASTGMLSYDDAVTLKKAGLKRYHNNLQTSPDKYSDIVSTTHTIDDRINSIRNAKKAGLEVCSGGIIGMGENIYDRVKMAFALKELGVDSVPLNILNPIKGTPLGDMPYLPMNEILKTIAVYRLILKDKTIKVAAGRETIVKDFMGSAFLCGANGLLVGGYLTLKGRSPEEDNSFIENIKKLWE